MWVSPEPFLDSMNKLPRRIIELAGWAPAIIFPLATVKQLSSVLFGSAEGVDPWPWFLFGVANLCLYVYSEKYLRPQALIGFLGTAVLDFVIVLRVLLGG